MILKELQKYVRKHHCVSLGDMEQHFRMDGDALRSMLNKLIKKGRINKLPMVGKCQSCTSCDRDILEFYEWNEGANFSFDKATR